MESLLLRSLFHPDRADLKLGNPGNGTMCGIGKDISTAFTEMEGHKHQALLFRQLFDFHGTYLKFRDLG